MEPLGLANSDGEQWNDSGVAVRSLLDQQVLNPQAGTEQSVEGLSGEASTVLLKTYFKSFEGGGEQEKAPTLISIK